MRTRRLPLLAVPFLLAGCGDLSNEIFADDLEFLDALPSEDRHTVEMDEDYADRAARAAAEGECDFPELLCLTVATAASINGEILAMLAIVDQVRATPPSERDEDRRAWGPFPIDDDVWVRLDMERAGGAYGWAFSGGASDEGPWTAFFTGEHYAGASVARGVGRFTFDYAALAAIAGEEWSGSIEVDYDTEEGTELLVHIAGFAEDGASDPLTADYWYAGDDEEGALEFRSPADINDNGTFEEYAVRSRWVRRAGGRADARVSGGDLDGLDDIVFTQCWGPLGRLVYQWDNYGFSEPVGEESDCVFPEFEDPEHL